MQIVEIKVVKDLRKKSKYNKNGTTDGRVYNMGRPINVKSARQVRLNKQAAVQEKMDYVMNGGWFKLTPNCNGAYTFVKTNESNINEGHIATMYGGHECNINKIGRTKMIGFTFVMNKKVNVEFDVRNIIKVEGGK